MSSDERAAAFGGRSMVRRVSARSGEQQMLPDRLRWHIQQALRRDGVCAVLVLRPLSQQLATQDQQWVTFDPVIERIREHIRRSDVLEADSRDGIGIVLSGTGSEGARAVFMRLTDALGASLPPTEPSEVSVHVGLGYAASSSLPGGNANAEHVGNTVREDGGAAMAASMEAMCKALMHAAWEARTVLALTLPEPTHTLHLRAAGPTRTQSSADTEAEPGLPRYRAGDDDQLPVEQIIEASDTEEQGMRHEAQRKHLRLLVSKPVALPEIETMRALARAMGVPFVRMPAHLPRSCRTALPAGIACELRAVPIGRTKGTLTMAMHDPSDTDAVERLHALTGLCIFPVLAAPDEIDRALRQLMGR